MHIKAQHLLVSRPNGLAQLLGVNFREIHNNIICLFWASQQVGYIVLYNKNRKIEVARGVSLSFVRCLLQSLYVCEWPPVANDDDDDNDED